jgi:hypothetical protein
MKKITPTTIPCPLRGHHHELPLVSHPTKKWRLIAYCGERAVYECSAYPAKKTKKDKQEQEE